MPLKRQKCYWFLFLIVLLSGCKRQLIFSDDFKASLNTDHWKIETQAGDNVPVYNKDGQLILDTKAGLTVWLDKKLKGNYRIVYDRTVILDSSKNARLSDLNQFWMAEAKPFDRNGVFEEYDTVELYYVGFGGNYNSTTRFRKYQGNGVKPIIAEYLDEKHLLKPNNKYRIVTTVKNGHITWEIDGEKLLDYQDSAPLKEGYFGFRTTWSKQSISNFRIERLR